MQYVKKVLVLKNIEFGFNNKKGLNGLVRIEIENGVAEMHLSLINFENTGAFNYYALVIDSNKNCYEFELGARPSSCFHSFLSVPDLTNGFCVGVYLVKDSLPTTKAFASDSPALTLQDFKKAVADRCLTRHKKLLQEQESGVCERGFGLNEQGFEKETLFQAYNDEAVATENYFEIDDEINKKILSLKDMENESLQLENELFDCECKEKAQKDYAKDLCPKNEKGATFGKEEVGKRHFDTVKAELDQIFFKFPEELSLTQHFKDSRWARIYYSNEKYYVVGVIFENAQEKYVCYGVPATYSKNPPKELAGFCSFIPLSVFDMFGAGYWIMFQDADTGKCVHFN